MNRFKTFLKLILIMWTAMTISACSKTVQWEEEVLLNTGETIWVSKKVLYTIKGQPGNPADMGYIPDHAEVISFKYSNKSYTYNGDARLMVLAISPQKLPVLLSKPGDNGWYRRHTYKCVNPYYVQFLPDSSGKQWTWPDRIELWTYNLPTNLMLHRDHPSDVKKRYTIADKSTQRFFKDPQRLSSQKINPLFVSDICKGSN